MGKQKCHFLVCTTPYPAAPSPAGSEASSESVSPEILSTKISRLQQLGEEYSHAFEPITNRRSLEYAGGWLYVKPSPAMGLHLRSTNSLSQDLSDTRQEEAKSIEQAEALLVGLGEWARVEECDLSKDLEEEYEEEAEPPSPTHHEARGSAPGDGATVEKQEDPDARTLPPSKPSPGTP